MAIATPDMMGVVGKLWAYPWPRACAQPRQAQSPLTVAKAVHDSKAGKVEFRVNKEAGMHVPIGKVSFTDEQLMETSRP